MVAILKRESLVDILKAQVQSVSEVEKIGTSETTGVEGVNKSVKLHLDNGKSFLWKPRMGEHLSSWRFVPAHQLYNREKAAYVIDRILGFGMVPHVRIATYEGDIGSLQYWVEDTSPADATLRTYSEKDIWKAGLFDLIIANNDRHSGNWLTKLNKPILIDNGFAFPSYAAKDNGRSLILSRFSYAIWDKPIPDLFLAKIDRLTDDEVKQKLSQYLGPKALGLMYERVDTLLARKRAAFPKYKIIKKLDKPPKKDEVKAHIVKSINNLVRGV